MLWPSLSALVPVSLCGQSLPVDLIAKHPVESFDSVDIGGVPKQRVPHQAQNGWRQIGLWTSKIQCGGPSVRL